MPALTTNIPGPVRRFWAGEDGAQVIEHALVTAVVSIALLLALKGLTAPEVGMQVWIDRVKDCLTGRCS